MKKVIWIINPYAGAPNYGMEYRHYYLGYEFVKKGYDVYIITSTSSHLLFNKPNVNKKINHEIIDGINYIWLKTLNYKKSTSIMRFLSIFHYTIIVKKIKINKPDIIIFSPTLIIPYLTLIGYKKKYNAKFIYEIKDVWPEALIEVANLSKYNPLTLLINYLDKKICKNSDYIVSLLPNIYLKLKNYGINENKIKFIPNGVTCNNIDSNNEKLINNNKFVVGYAGSLGIMNAMKYFIEAAKELSDNKDIIFVIYGNGSEKEILENSCKGYDNILFYDSVSLSEINEKIKEFDICYIGWENKKIYEYGISANKLFTYMLAGKPIIHSVNSFNDPVKESGCGISVEAANVEKIKEAIILTKNISIDERIKMGEKGKEYVIKNHNYVKLAEKYTLLFE